MLKFNTMRFGTDEFSFSRQALLVSKKPFDTTGQTSVEGFTISGNEPTGTTRRFIFKVDDNLYKFSGSNVVSYTSAGELEDILANGNTAAEVNAVTSIPAWLNKKIYPIIALQAPVDASGLPTANITLKVRCQNDVYEKIVETPEYELAVAEGSSVIPRIADISVNTAATGNASVAVAVKLQNPSGEWSDYMGVTDALNQEAVAVQFRFTFTVTTLNGADSVKVNSINVKHTMGATAVSGDTAEIYSIVQNYESDLQTCYVIVKHKELVDSKIQAFVNFMSEPKKRVLIPLGTASGVLEQFSLGVDGEKDTGINQGSIQVFADGVPVTNFSYNVEVSEVTVNATAGAAITASYEYGHDKETWLEMPVQVYQQPYLDDGTYMTRFSYTLDDDDAVGMKMSNIRIQLYRPTGHVDRASLGVGTGLIQQFVLEHQAKQETIDCNADWQYDPDSQILTCVAEKGTEIVISYDWLGENQTLYSFTAGWSAAV